MINPDVYNLMMQASEMTGVPPELLWNQGMWESNLNPNAVGTSGEQGMMQIMPGTQQLVGITQPFDPKQSILGAAQYDASLYHQFGNSWPHALAAYNMGPAALQNSINAGEGIPQRIMSNYVNPIMGPPMAHRGQPSAPVASPTPTTAPTPAPPPAPAYDPVADMREYTQMSKEAIPAAPLESMPGQEAAGNAFKAAQPTFGSELGATVTDPFFLAMSGIQAAGTDWSNPREAGTTGGSIAGGAIGTAVGGPIGGVIGSTAGSMLGKLFPDKKEEEAKKQQKYAFLSDWMNRTADQMRSYGLDRRKAIDNITNYFNGQNAGRPYQFTLPG